MQEKGKRENVNDVELERQITDEEGRGRRLTFEPKRKKHPRTT
jgi:hypothetical protein